MYWIIISCSVQPVKIYCEILNRRATHVVHLEGVALIQVKTIWESLQSHVLFILNVNKLVSLSNSLASKNCPQSSKSARLVVFLSATLYFAQIKLHGIEKSG